MNRNSMSHRRRNVVSSMNSDEIKRRFPGVHLSVNQDGGRYTADVFTTHAGGGGGMTYHDTLNDAMAAAERRATTLLDSVVEYREQRLEAARGQLKIARKARELARAAVPDAQ